ncbi:MAG TPA: hypothetical protein ENJ82_10765, partial [Bacteroidetes bacterium]|nr:hypothetical protein [Bacteroidota bacterium]
TFQWLHAQHHTLANGLDLVYLEDSTRELLHVSVTLRGGPLLDLPDADGLSNFYSYLLTDRSDSLPKGGRLQTALQPLGILRHQATYEESNFFSLSMRPQDLGKGLGLLATVIQYPGFDSSSLARLKPILATDLQTIEGSPQYYHLAALRAKLWGKEAFRKNLPGSYAQLAALNAEWIRNHFANFLHPRNALLAATGNIPADAFFQICDSLFSGWKSDSQPGNIPPFAPVKLEKSIYFITENAFASFPVLTLAWPATGILEAPQTVAQQQLFTAMASLKRGKFYRALVGKGLAHHLEWTYTPTAYQDQIILSVIPVPDSLISCLHAVRKELQALAQPAYFSARDRKAAQRSLAIRFGQRDDRSLDRLAAIGRAWARHAPDWQSQQVPKPNSNLLSKIAAALSPEKPHIAGLLVNATLGSVTNLDSIFSTPLSGAVAAVNLARDTAPPPPPDPRPDLGPLTSFRIYFESSSFQADAPSLIELEQLVAILKAYPKLNLFVNGYSDGIGDGVYNYQLSIQRAESIKQLLIASFGVRADRLSVRGFGEAFAEFPDDTPEHSALNRRVSFEIAP